MKKLISKIISGLNLNAAKEIFMIRLGMRKELFKQKAAAISKVYQNIIKPGMTVFDIGANQGHYAAAFIKLGAEVVCAEPQTDCFKILKARYKNNPKVHLLNCAVDCEQGEKKIHISNMNTISSMSEDWILAVKDSKRFPDAEWSKEATVKTVTLESLIAKYGRPGFIKIDVEGYELNVLKGLKSKVPLISIEYTYEIIENAVKCIEYLKSIGEILIVLDDTNIISDESKWMKPEDVITALRSLKDSNANGDLFIKFVF